MNAFLNKEPQLSAEKLQADIRTELQTISKIAAPRRASYEVLDLARRAQANLRDLENRYRIARPRIGLSKTALRDWETYNQKFASLRTEVFKPAREYVDKMLVEESENVEFLLSRHVRTETSLDGLREEWIKSTTQSTEALKKEVEKLGSNASEITAQCLHTLESEVRSVHSDIQRLDFDEMSDEFFVETRNALENRVIKVAEDQKNLLDCGLGANSRSRRKR